MTGNRKILGINRRPGQLLKALLPWKILGPHHYLLMPSSWGSHYHVTITDLTIETHPRDVTDICQREWELMPQFTSERTEMGSSGIDSLAWCHRVRKWQSWGLNQETQ